VTESFDVVIAVLGDEVYMFAESKGWVKSNSEEFDVISKSYRGAGDVDAGDVG
jgi:hypothetical protein